MECNSGAGNMKGFENEGYESEGNGIEDRGMEVEIIESNVNLQNALNANGPAALIEVNSNNIINRNNMMYPEGMEDRVEVIDMATMSSVRSPEKAQRGPAVVVRGAFKSYGSSPVLQNFNMTVNEGTIYSLLGSSGCGKTTILSAIVGIKNLDGGEIRVFGEKPGTPESGIPGKCVGHMPQEYALYPDFSVQESFQYYGFIYGMSRTKVKERSEFLLKFLDLPKPTRRIGTLSGGQKRRVSLAIAMIHEPKLLILDEPTVGVDHLLRENIWHQLHHLVGNGKTTVIITTHYIEESRGSNTIGLMRNGRLLTEKSPDDLLKEHNVTLLEEVVLNLSRNDAELESSDFKKRSRKSLTSSKKDISLSSVPDNFNKEEKEAYKHELVSFSRLQALVTKNIILLVRNVLFLLFNFFSPSLQIVVVCLAIGTAPKNLQFGVVNHENPMNCVNITKDVAPIGDDCVPENWSCKFLDVLPVNDVINLRYYESEMEAYEDITKGYIWGYMSFPQDFSQQLQERLIGGAFPTNESIEGSTITFEMDMSSQTIASVLERMVLTSFQKFASQRMEDCGYDKRVGQLPVEFKDPVYGSSDTTFREYLAPSILLGLLFFFPLCSSGITYITERKAGTLDRSLVAGVTTIEVMVSNLITQTLVLFGQAGFAFVMLTQVFQIHIQGSTLAAIVLTILIGIGGMSMGFLISTFCHEEIHAVLLAMGTFFPNFLLAGMVWPIEGMPLVLQYIGYLLPCTLACESMRSIISRGWGVMHYRVWPGFVSTIAWIAVYWILTIFIHKRSHKMR